MNLREEIKSLYKEIRENPNQFGCLKTDELLSAYEKEGNKYLDNKSNQDIEDEKLGHYLVKFNEEEMLKAVDKILV